MWWDSVHMGRPEHVICTDRTQSGGGRGAGGGGLGRNSLRDERFPFGEMEVFGTWIERVVAATWMY